MAVHYLAKEKGWVQFVNARKLGPHNTADIRVIFPNGELYLVSLITIASDQRKLAGRRSSAHTVMGTLWTRSTLTVKEWQVLPVVTEKVTHLMAEQPPSR